MGSDTDTSSPDPRVGSFSLPPVTYPHTFLTLLPGGNKKLDGGMVGDWGAEIDRDGLIETSFSNFYICEIWAGSLLFS